MTDRELDRMMQHVLLDAIKRDCEKETDDVPAFKPTHHYQRQMAEMLKDPLKWERRRARPLWKNVAQKAAVILLVFSLSLGSLMAVSPTVRAAVVRLSLIHILPVEQFPTEKSLLESIVSAELRPASKAAVYLTIRYHPYESIHVYDFEVTRQIVLTADA